MTDQITARYEVMRVLGSGGIGITFLCRDREESDRLVVLKGIFGNVPNESDTFRQLRREFELTSAISHPNLLEVFDCFVFNDTLFLAMEFAEGGDLDAWLVKRGEPTIGESTQLIIQLLDGLQAIHAAGFVHGDLKPANILLTAEGSVKLVDFGIRRHGSAPNSPEDAPEVEIADTVAPEYSQHGKLDARSDIYSVGVIAYELIAGESPFCGANRIESMTNRLKGLPPPLRERRFDCPVALNDAVMRALAHDPDARFQRAAEMAAELRATLVQQ